MSEERGNGDGAVVTPEPPEQLPAPGGHTVTHYAGPFTTEDETAGVALAEDRDERGEAPEIALVPPVRRSLRAGCYLLRYTPLPRAAIVLPTHYDGTLRVQREPQNTIASGDLYVHRPVAPHLQLPPKEPNPAAGIPVFPIAAYRYYVRVTQILETATLANKFTLGFELHRYTHATHSWSLEGPFTAVMTWTPAPAGFPRPRDYLRGTVKNAAGKVTGTLAMGWVSPFLRKATIELDRVAQSEPAVANAAGVGWHALFEQAGWDLTVDESDANVTETSGESWSNAEAHAAMLSRRDSADLDREWRYWLVCVRRLDATERGIMFDNGATDSNNVPREGAAMASHWMIPNTPAWGLVRGMRFGAATDPYFRTGVHEIGHAMGLYHNTVDNGFMNTTDVISASAVPPQQFPQNIKWAHAPDDQKRLRHMPDIWVRPGGIPFGFSYTTAPVSPDDSTLEPDGVVLDVRPLIETVPIGAPVRVDIDLRNDVGLAVPADLSLSAGHVTGTVTDPSGTVRSFRSVIECIEAQRLDHLEHVSASLTLLRGAEGALFPMAGPHTIRVQARWEVDGVPILVAGEASVMVTPAVDDAHAGVALRILTTPDTLLTLAIGGDHLTDGIEAIAAALDNDVLRPHYAFTEAKRVATPFFEREADLDRANELLHDGTVMSASEVDKAARLVVAAGRRGSEISAPLVDTIRDKAEQLGATEALDTLKTL